MRILDSIIKGNLLLLYGLMLVFNKGLLLRGVVVVPSFFRPSSVAGVLRTSILDNSRETTCIHSVEVTRPFSPAYSCPTINFLNPAKLSNFP